DLSELGRRIDDSVAVGNEAASRADAVRADIAGIRWRLAEFDVLMDVVRRAMPEAPTLEQLSRAPRPLDSLYGALEEVMRGTHEVVVERVRPYVEDIAVVGANGPVIDVGCGRGEWLEVLRDAGVESYGIDINPVYEGLWASKSLDVRVGDVREHLEKLKPGSVRAISALHVVEHLPTDDLLEFLSLALRALAPGGLILLETPNPENLLVGAWSFYLDPTHRQPIPARLLAFFVGSRGFSDVQTRYLTRPELALVPTPDPGKPWGQDVAPVVEAINQHLFAPQDYAVLARRA
ncbi:MAG: methyltransferase domain protein, partial [Acidimicrobiaceae bacterium]|nr:methyltransferase domain protein [Acidimicrobiaceae bacterium]